jgi:glycerol kinase
MKTGYILSLDQKHGGCEVLIFDMDGYVRSRVFAESIHWESAGGWLKQDPEEICSTAMRAIADALEAGGIFPRELRVIGITNESDAMVLWERNSGRPLGCSVMRLGEDGVPEGDDLYSRRVEKMTQEATGLAIDPCRFAGFKLCWMLSRLPELRKRAEHRDIACGMLDSWLIYRLTGGKVHITDISNALRTRLYDMRMRTWNLQLLDLLDIPIGILPRVRPLSEGYGETERSAFFGVEGIPLAGIAEHQKAVLFG